MMRTRLILLCAIALPVLVVHAQTSSGTAIVLSPPAALAWKPGAAGVEQVALWGDREHGANGTMSRYPVGFELKRHYHTNEMRGVILSGTWILSVVNGEIARLPAGSYFSLPGKTAHTDRCDGPDPCVLFIMQDDRRDTVFLDAPIH